MARLSPQGPFRAFSFNGEPLDGGLLYTYEAGTSTPKPTYTDESQDTQNTNPVELDVNGYANVWLESGAYKFILKDSAGVTQWTLDDIVADAPNSFGASIIPVDANISITPVYANTLFLATNSPTFTLLPVAQAGEGFYIIVKNIGVGTVTIAPDGSETINGTSSLTMGPGVSGVIITDGTSWQSLFNIDLTGYVTLTGVQTLTNKTLTSPTINTPVITEPAVTGATSSIPVAGHLWGLTLSNNVSDATNDIDIAAGRCTDSTNAYNMTLTALTKQSDVAWAVGTNAGMLDTGVVGNNTYHVYVIKRLDTGVTDIISSLSASAPTLPANYTVYRRIGSFVRLAGSIRAFKQRGNRFLWNVPVLESTTSIGNTASDVTLTLPTGIELEAWLRATVGTSSSQPRLLLYSKEVADTAIGTALYTSGTNNAAFIVGSGHVQVSTNTSAQVRAIASDASTSVAISTYGWVDYRGTLY